MYFTNFHVSSHFGTRSHITCPPNLPLSYCTPKCMECADFVTRLNLVYDQMIYKYYIYSQLMSTLERVSSDI